MSTISVITPPSEPDVVQLYAVGLDVSAAYVAGVSQATWWLSTQEARQLCHNRGANLLPTVEGGTEEIIRTNGEDPRGHEGGRIGPRGFCGRYSVIAAFPY